MRHKVSGRKLGRNSSHRKALMRTMVTELLENERMITTVAKAKELRSVAEKMITLGKKETLHARRQALGFIRKKSVVHKLFETLAPRFADRQGGYTRILRLGERKGDAAELALLELLDGDLVPESPSSEKKKAKKPEPKAKAADKKPAVKKQAGKKPEKKPVSASKKTASKSKPKAEKKAPARKKSGAGKKPASG
jgi:large subunit ribosomal protein L17